MSTFLMNFLKERGLDGLLLVGDSICHPDIYYLSRFLSHDRFALLACESVSILVSSMELSRARKESTASAAFSTSEYGITERLKSDPRRAYGEVLAEFLKDQGQSRLAIPDSFPVGICRALEERFEVSIVKSPIREMRSIKSPGEIEAITEAQRACEDAMRTAEMLISRSRVSGEMLVDDRGPLTSERVRGAIEVSLLTRGFQADGTIVAGGQKAADPHFQGSGPLPANSPIVIDIFPRSSKTRYYADMTRTMLRGEASLEIEEMYEAVFQAQAAGLGALRSGIEGCEVHELVCQSFRDMGYPEREKVGYIHSTGHGVGLEVHETPSISEAGEMLLAGNVVTVEPGLYYPSVGGIRLEDLVVVEEGGCRDLTVYERRLVV